MMEDNPGPSAQKLYMQLTSDRAPYLERARACAKYTIPALMVAEGSSGASALYKPFQSIGARCVNNLSSKLLLTLIAPTRRFYRLKPTPDAERKMNPDDRPALELALSKIEEAILRGIEKRGVRSRLFEALRQLVVAGNVLVHVDKKTTRVFPLHQFVVRRDHEGNLLDIVVEEKVDPRTLPMEHQSKISEVLRQEAAEHKSNPNPAEVCLYTHITRKGEQWTVRQECKGIEVSSGTYGTDSCPWLALRWHRIDGESYGRSHCDDYFGDLLACENISRSIVRFAVMAAKVVFLVKPGLTKVDDLNRAEEGEYVPGDKEEVEALSIDKTADFTVANAVLSEINSRLSFAFLLNSAVRRQGERVTAEEIRYMAQELEDALGGTYSVLSQDLQLPLVRIVMTQMRAANELPALPEKFVEPTIVTGIDALGRSHELARLDAFLGGALQTFGPQVLQYIKVPGYLRQRAAGLDLDPSGILKTDDEVAAEMEQAQTQQLTEKLGPPAIKATSDQMLAAQQAQTQTNG